MGLPIYRFEAPYVWNDAITDGGGAVPIARFPSYAPRVAAPPIVIQSLNDARRHPSYGSLEDVAKTREGYEFLITRQAEVLFPRAARASAHALNYIFRGRWQIDKVVEHADLSASLVVYLKNVSSGDRDETRTIKMAPGDGRLTVHRTDTGEQLDILEILAGDGTTLRRPTLINYGETVGIRLQNPGVTTSLSFVYYGDIGQDPGVAAIRLKRGSHAEAEVEAECPPVADVARGQITIEVIVDPLKPDGHAWDFVFEPPEIALFISDFSGLRRKIVDGNGSWFRCRDKHRCTFEAVEVGSGDFQLEVWDADQFGVHDVIGTGVTTANSDTRIGSCRVRTGPLEQPRTGATVP